MNNEVLFKLSYGMYIVSSINDGKYNAQIANSVFQVASSPVLVAISINKQNLTHEYILKSKIFCVSIINEQADMVFIGKFGFKSGRDLDKFKNTNYRIEKLGSPIILDNTLGYLEVKVVSSIDAVTHTVFIGEILNMDLLNETKPMTYEYYHIVKKGKSPTSAPTFVKMKPV
jgi:ferric-chelate reductase [NAD(P)H]